MSGEESKVKIEQPNSTNDNSGPDNAQQQRPNAGGVGGGGPGPRMGMGMGGMGGMGMPPPMGMGNMRGGRGGRKGTRFMGPGRGGGMAGRMDGSMKMDNMGMDGGMDGGGGGPGMMGPGMRGGMRGGPRGGRGGQGGPMMTPRSQDDRLMERILQIGGPTHELPPQDNTEKKFMGRNRLYVGNLTNDISEEEIQQMFQVYGELTEVFINKEKNFAFLRMDYRANAEKAKRELDGSMRKGRVLKVRFAPNSSIVKVKNLTPFVSNELLERAFSVFGEIERAVVIVDERGKSLGEGIIEFARKPSAVLALRKCTEGCFFLTGSLRPVVVEAYEPLDDVDGYPDKSVPKKGPEFAKAREIGPRFAHPESFEHEYGTRWKQLYELYKQKEEALKREMAMEEQKLEAQMEFARYEHETELLRERNYCDDYYYN